MQGLFAAVAPGNINANIMGNSTTGTIASTSEGLMQDYRAGFIIGSTPRAMTIAQIVGAPIGAAALAWSYPLLVETYGIIGDTAELAAPASRRAAGFAEVLSAGVDKLPATALIAALIATVLGIAFALMEQSRRWRWLVPSPTGVSIGMLIPFAANAPIIVGAIFATLWMLFAKRSAGIYMIPLASGFIAGEALVAVLVPLLLWLGLGGG
jgi:uncharacterized oligopeptide transporter (OPT) family protein